MAMDLPAITWANGSRQPIFLIVLGVLLAISIMVVFGRFFCRIHHVKQLGLDDYFIAAAICVEIALATMNIFHIQYGTGLHVSDLPVDDPNAALIPTLKYWYGYQIVYPLALFFVKISFLALYWRIFGQTRYMRISILVVGGIVVAYTIIVMFVNAFECGSNLSQSWSPTFPQGCMNLPAAYFSMAAINIVTDVVILILPIPPLLRLQLNDRKRYALVAIFLVGSIAVLASIVRLHAVYIYLNTDDVSYDAIFILLWSQIEINLAITCASIPTLRPLFAQTFGSTNAYFSRDRQGASGSNPLSANAPGDGHSRSRRSGNVELYSMSGRGKQAKEVVGMDNDSEEMILGKDTDTRHITRTIETNVSTSPRPSVTQHHLDNF